MYFSNKLKSAIAYQKFLNEGNKIFHEEAIELLGKANDHWHEVVNITSPIYEQMPLQHYSWEDDKNFHWSKVEKQVIEELEWLKGQGTNN